MTHKQNLSNSKQMLIHTCNVCERKSLLSKGLCFCEGSGVRNGVKLSGWMVDSQEFVNIDWITFSERTVAESCDFILDS